MGVIFQRGNLFTVAKTVRMTSFIYTEASEVNLQYENLFKEYVIDTVEGYAERQNIYYDPYNYSDYLDRITSSDFFDRKEVYIGERYNTFFDEPEYNLEYITSSSFSSLKDSDIERRDYSVLETNLDFIELKYSSEIYQSLDNLLSTGMSYQQIIDNLQKSIVYYSSMTLDQIRSRQDYAKRNFQIVTDRISEISDKFPDSKSLLQALYFSRDNKDFEGAMNPLDGTLNLNKVSVLLNQARVQNIGEITTRSDGLSLRTLRDGNYFFNVRDIVLDVQPGMFEETVPILQNPETGLYFLEFSDSIDKIDDSMFFDSDVDRFYETKNLIYGSPKQEYHPINSFFKRYIPTIEQTEMYTTEGNDLLIDLSPVYISDSDRTFVRSIFYVELDDYQDYLGYMPYVKPPTDSFYIPDEQFLQTKIIYPEKEIFKFKYQELKFGGKYVVTEVGDVFIFYNSIEARYAGYHTEYDTLYEYINDLILSTNTTKNEYIKPYEGLYLKTQSNHPSNGGSHLGHFVPHIVKLEDNRRLLETDFFKVETSKNVAQEWAFTQIVIGKNSFYNNLFEFEEVEHDLEINTVGQRYTFEYEIVNARLPFCLTINNSIVSGTVGESEKFLNEYSTESWIGEQNLNIDLNYDDFNPDPIKEITVELVGRAITEGTIDLIESSNIRIMDTIIQYNSDGSIQTTAKITGKLFDYVRTFSIGEDLVDLTITRFEIDRIEGIFDVSFRSAIAIDGESRTQITEGFNVKVDRLADQSFTVFESELITVGGLVKNIDLIFPINNNYTYDKDRFLLTNDDIFGEENKLEKLNRMRSQGHYRYNVTNNIKLIQESIDDLNDDYAAGRTNLTPEQYLQEIEFLESSKGDPTEEQPYERLEEIEEFVLDCNILVDEETFYKDSPERKTTRGYPSYASCN